MTLLPRARRLPATTVFLRPRAQRQKPPGRGSNWPAILLSLSLHAALLVPLSSAFVAYYRPKLTIAEPAIVSWAPPVRDKSPIVNLQMPRLPLPEGTPQWSNLNDIAATIPDAPEIPAPTAGRAAIHAGPPEAARRLPVELGSLAAPTELPVGGGLEGRQAEARAQLVADHGGSPQSEAAVERGLAWLVAHQHADGGWRFDHSGSACDGRCRSPGLHESTTAATALALLPLLGAGHTPLEGTHQVSVLRGLDYLRRKMKRSANGGDLQEGTMYAQGLAGIALAEAFALCGESDLGEAAQQAIDFTAAIQHPAGGWRYYPGQPGDTTVLGWQWMALKSGQMAGLRVPPGTFEKAGRFLDGVASEGGAAYGYQSPELERTPTAIGLLCRMYSGWRRTDPRIVRGTELLVAWGPSYDDMYFNYYAAQVLHHAETPSWDAWNERLRNHLVATQALRGHEEGSWHFADYHTAPGGRLCDTALALMILEVYYRHLPLYCWKSVEF